MCEDKRNSELHLRMLERSEDSENKTKAIEECKKNLKNEQKSILKLRNQKKIAERRLTCVFSFYTKSIADVHFAEFREFLKQKRIQYSEEFIIHDIRKIVLN